MSTKPKLPTKPLPLSDILRDLAVLRTSGHDIQELFKLPVTNNGQNGTEVAAESASQVDSSVALSYEYVKEARVAIRLHDSGKVETQGVKIDDARRKYDELLDGMDGGQ